MVRTLPSARAPLSATAARLCRIAPSRFEGALRRVRAIGRPVDRARSPWRAAAMILAAVTPGAALSAIIPVSQDRNIEAFAIAAAGAASDLADDQAAAAGFGAFVAMVEPEAVAASGGSFAIAQGSASQASSIGTHAVAAQGAASLSLTLPSSGAGSSAQAGGDSLFELRFMVDVLSSFSLNGSVDTQAIVTGGAGLPTLGNTVILEDLGNSAILFEALTDDETFSFSGLLNPGITYRLLASAGIDANQMSSNTEDRTVSGNATFDINLQLTPRGVPEPGSTSLVFGGLAALALGRRRVLASRSPSRPPVAS